MTGSVKRMRSGLWAVVVVVALAPLAGAADETNEFEKLLAERGPALVAVKYVLKDPASTQQREMEVAGVVVDPTGLVLCANTRLGGNPLGGTGLTPTEIKVLVGDDTEGKKAEIVARDTELALGWLRITDPLPGPLPYIDLEKSAKATAGSRVLAIRLLDKYFNRAPIVSEGRLGGKLSKPRDLYVPAQELNTEPGLPLFLPGGELLGFVVVQIPDAEARRLSGQPINTRDVVFVLPAEQVLRATRLAREQMTAEQPATPAASEAATETNKPADGE